MKRTPGDVMKSIMRVVEYTICAIILVGIITGLWDLIKYVKEFALNPSSKESYDIFSNFLKHALMLVVGIELIYMIISHKNETILTLVLFVIARKMLVYAEGMTDILIGTISIVLVFITMKFILIKESSVKKADGTFSAGISLTDLNKLYKVNIEAKEHTLGGLIVRIASESNVPLFEGGVYSYGPYTMKVIKMTDGVIEKVAIEEIDG